MPRSGPRAIRKYSDEFKLTAVRLSRQPGIQVKTVAAALEIHPFMLSKWHKDVRDGVVRGRAPTAPPPGPAREIGQLQALERAYAESFFHSLKAELTRGVVFPTERTLRSQLKQYMRYYNTIRLHSGLAYLSPLAFEQRLA